LSLITLVIGDRALIVQFEGVGKTAEGSRSGGGRGGPSGAQQGPRVTERSVRGRQALSELFTNPYHFILAFDLARLALALYHEQEIAILNGIDLQDCMPNGGSRAVVDAVKFAVGDEATVWERNVQAAFKAPFLTPNEKERDRSAVQRMVSRAWVSHYIAKLVRHATSYEIHHV
jgi:hypothetical protein